MLPFRVKPASGLLQRPVQSVLLTGASGFLGVHLMAELRKCCPEIRIKALVRTPEKLVAQLDHYGLSFKAPDEVITGTLPGISPEMLPDADLVIHSAARIHGLAPRSALWADNVQAFAKIIERYLGSARICLVSTLSVFVSSNHRGRHSPCPLPVSSRRLLYGGYAQTKYVAECLAHHAGSHIVRLGLLTGSSSKGQCPEGDFLGRFMRAMHLLGVRPPSWREAFVDLTPVDFAAHQMAQCVLADSPDNITHIANPQSASLSEVLSGFSLKTVSVSDFKARLAMLPRLEQMLVRYAFFKEESLLQHPDCFNLDVFQSTGHNYMTTTAPLLTNKELLSLYRKGLFETRQSN